RDVARAILDIAKAQYAPEEKEKSRYVMETSADDDEVDSMPSDEDEDSDVDAEPRIVEKTMGKKFTIENIGHVSMQVKSRTRPLELLSWATPTFKMENGKVMDASMVLSTMFQFVTRHVDQTGLKALLDMGVHFASQKLEGDEEEASGFFT